MGRGGPTVADVVRSMVGEDLPVFLEAYDGSRVGREDASTHVVVRSPDALRRMVTAPGVTRREAGGLWTPEQIAAEMAPGRILLAE